MNPKNPVYIISKGRWESRMTSKALERCKVPYHIVVEPQEYDNYAAVINPKKIKVLPFSNLGQGSIPARNWVWEDSIKRGFDWHWILDDNIRDFWRLFHNQRQLILCGNQFAAIEDFVDRYTNIGIAGMQYDFFATEYPRLHPFKINSRVYSCLYIRNSLPFRWRGRYNEDTDLCIRVMKAKWCTVLFYAFLIQKMNTMTMKGGNTDLLYKQDKKFDGRLEMAKSLQNQHPEMTDITYKWNRYQHKVDYSLFKQYHNMKLIRKPGIVIPDRINEFGMVFKPNPYRTEE